MLTLLLFLVIFSVLVLVHEVGHFFVAKWCGMKVEEFGMGLPPRAWTIWTDRSGTRYTLNWIPFGGFVRLLGENGPEAVPNEATPLAEEQSVAPLPPITNDESYRAQRGENGQMLSTAAAGKGGRGDFPTAAPRRLFTDFPLWQRIGVVVAGVVMNLLLSVVLLTVVFSVGFRPLSIVDDHMLPFDSYLIQSDSFAKANGTLKVNQDPTGIPVEKVELGSVAEKAGLLPGDRIVAVGETRTLSGVDVSQALFDGRGKEVAITIKRQGEEQTVRAGLLPDQPFGIYITPDIEVVPLRFAPHVAVVRASEEVAKQTILTVVLLKDVVLKLASSGEVPDGVAGPVGIFQMTGEVSQAGAIPTLIFVALLSVSLAVMNIMPFPALDGGRFLFLLIELVTRRRPNQRVESLVHAAGFGILLLLIGLITFNDIGRLFAA